MTKLRKIFTASVMLTTILSLSVVAAPKVKASASAGDLIKMNGLASVYYLGADGKRYVFPNESTYFSWYSDFSGVVTIPQAELESYPLGANVTMRPGTKLVKITTNPKVYAVESKGTLVGIPDEATAVALFGNDWSKKVIDVPDAFFTNYSIKSGALSATAYPEGSLIKKPSDSSVYYINADGKAQKIATESAFLANRFKWDNVITTSASFSMPVMASDITAGVSTVVDTSQGGGAGNIVVGGSGLSVALASDTPSAANVPAGASKVLLAKANLTASNDGAVSVNSIKIKRIGLGNYDDFSKVWIEKAGVKLSSQKSFTTNDEAVVAVSPALTIEAGRTVTVEIYGSVAASSLGSNGGVTIASASDITTTGGAAVSGSFPISGNLMSFATGYTVTSAVFSNEVTSTTSTYTVGDTNVELGRFSIEADGSKDLKVTSVAFKNSGNANLSNVVSDLYIEKSGTKVSESATIDGKSVTFKLANGGVSIAKDETETFKIIGSIIGQDSSNNTIQFKLDNKEDLSAMESDTGYFAAVKSTQLFDGTNAWSTVSSTDAEDLYATLAKYTINAGNITVSKKSTSPSDQSVTKSTNNVVALIANIKAKEAFTADSLRVDFDSTSKTLADKTQNMKVYLNGTLLDSVNLATADETAGYKVFSQNLTINAGDNEVKVVYDVMSTATNEDLIVKLVGGSTLFGTPEYVSNGESVTSGSITGSAIGGKVSVATAGFTATRSDGFSDNRTIVKGTNDVVLSKMTLKAQNDSIKVTSVALSSNTGASTQLTDTHISGMKLFVDGVQVGSERDFASGASFSLGSDSIVIAKETTKVVELRGSFDSSSESGRYFKTTMTFTGEDSAGKSVTSQTASTVQFLMADSGTLSVAKDGDSPVAGMFAANSTGKETAKFKFTATNDDIKIKIKKVYVSNVKGISADNRISAVKLYNGTTLLGSGVPTNGEVYFNLTTNPVTVEKSKNVVLSVSVDLNQIEEEAQTNADIQMAITKVTAESSAGVELTSTNNALVNFAAGTDLDADATAAATSLTVASSAAIATGTVIKIDSEEMLVTGVSSSTAVTVTRGINGTTAASHTSGAGAITKVTAISGDSFRVRKTVPTVSLVSLPSTVLTSGDNVVAKVKIAADANEDVTVSSIVFTAAAAANTIVATSTASNSVKVNGSTYSAATVAPDKDNVTGNALSKVTVTFTTPIVIAAGSDKTVEVVVNVVSVGTTGDMWTKIAEDSSYLTTGGSLMWSDNADPTDYSATLQGSYKVNGIPSNSQTITKS